jgi:hypothetical protein
MTALLNYMGFSTSLLPVGKNMQKTHGTHADEPLTKSFGLIYLFIIGGRKIDLAQRRAQEFRPYWPNEFMFCLI